MLDSPVAPNPVAFAHKLPVARRCSIYIPVSDGVRLAADIFRPFHDRPQPALCCSARYHRCDPAASPLDTAIPPWLTCLDAMPWLRPLLRDYCIVCVDVRGSGASFGWSAGCFSPREAQDAAEVIAWLAAQPWCDGNVGLFGRSYSGIAQYFAAARQPPALRCIFPEMAVFDLYGFLFRGGILRRDFAVKWNERVRELDQVYPAPPVDGDADCAQLAAALEEHRKNLDAFAAFTALRHRDDAHADGARLHVERSPSSQTPRGGVPRVPAMHFSGWRDLWVADAFLHLENGGPDDRLVVGPGHHSSLEGFDLSAAHTEWSDRWLRGKEEATPSPRIRYCTLSAETVSWHECEQWPPPSLVNTALYLGKGTALVACPGESARHVLHYRAEASSGSRSRWANGYGAHFDPTSSNLLRHGVQFAVSFETAVTITGHPVMHLWIDAAEDCDVFAFLLDVDGSGVANVVTEGMLRASHRRLSAAPYRNFDLPYHSGLREDVLPVAAGPMELVFEMLPLSWEFGAGHSLVLVLTRADADNAEVLEFAGRVEVLCGPEWPSRLVLPVAAGVLG